MEYFDAKLLISAAGKSQWPDSELPEIVLAGKSNVGKSSLINTLLNRKSLAYVGKTPGKTRLLNFYEVNQQFMMVDVPGYGFAQRSQKELIDFGTMMEDYFSERKQLKVCIQIIDLRHGPSKDDLMMLDYVRSNGIPVLIVATKQDQCNQSETSKNRKMISEKCNVPLQQIVLFSSKTRRGRDELMEKIETYIR
ncbi:MAG: YihA family ribosome biogenesis GTP-binding protein [Erysipelotrichaceae bacterium]|jgi:GTP-binding protein|nr:YihA family ribosome biogenesis GTP-binding protein [Erysipelotrichaceae bacterium]